jgi:hypothetical protein
MGVDGADAGKAASLCGCLSLSERQHPADEEYPKKEDQEAEPPGQHTMAQRGDGHPCRQQDCREGTADEEQEAGVLEEPAGVRL